MSKTIEIKQVQQKHTTVRKNTDGDYVLKKGDKEFGRFSVHKGIRDGSYVFSHKWDRNTYYDAFNNGQLGDDPYKAGKAYEIKIKNIEPVKIRAAKNVVADLINDYGEEFEKKHLNEMYKELADLGYYDEGDYHAHFDAADKYREHHAREKDKEKLDAELENYEDRITELATENLFKKKAKR